MQKVSAFHSLVCSASPEFIIPSPSTLPGKFMAWATRSSIVGFNLSDQWFLTAATIVVGGILGYVVYDAVMATASELLQRLLVISPLLLVITVHWLSAGSHLSLPLPGSEPGAIHRAGGSPWGVAFVLVLLLFLIAYQPSLNGLIF